MQRCGWTTLLMLAAALSSSKVSAVPHDNRQIGKALTIPSPTEVSAIATAELAKSSRDSFHKLVASDEDTAMGGSNSQMATDVGSSRGSTSSGSGSSVSGSSSSSGNSSSSNSSESEPPSASDSGSYYNATAGYDCSCSDARKVSLMGASDYCLAPGARYSGKCGNQMLGDLGECPRAGAQPCSELGHMLTSDAVCELDEKDEVYKCVASEDDQNIQSGKKPKKDSSSHGSPNVGDSGATTPATRLASVLTVAAVALVGGLGVIF